MTDIRGDIVHGPCLSEIKLFYLHAECLELTRYLMREAAEGTSYSWSSSQQCSGGLHSWMDVLQVGADNGF